MVKVGLVSLGCSKNLVDSERMLGFLTQAGYELTNDAASAEVLIVNTCGFIEAAKRESIDAILEMVEYKQKACETLVVTGCLSQRYREELVEELPEVDIFLGVDEYERLPGLLHARHFPSVVLGPLRERRVLATPSHYAYLRIADGCDNRCSFCAIPLIRGGYKSLPMEQIVEEASALVSQGVKELVVIAQDTTRYGVDLYGRHALVELLEKLCRLDVAWIRLLYAYPNELDDALIELIVSQEKIVNYLDIPLQHVDDVLLRRMNRRSSIGELKTLYEKLRVAAPDFALRTTLITGFPGETEEQFQTLLHFMREHPFDRVGVFCYSAEEGTPAATFPDPVDAHTAQRRAEELMLQQERISKERLAQRVGRTYKVLVEGYDASRELYSGRSAAEAPEIDGQIYFQSSDPCNAGSFVPVVIDRVEEHDLYGRVENIQPCAR